MIERPNRDQRRAIKRLNFVTSKLNNTIDVFTTHPKFNLVIINPDTPEEYIFPKEIALRLLQSCKNSLERSMRDAGLDDRNWKKDYYDFIRGEAVKDPEREDIDSEGHIMSPQFIEKRGSDKIRRVLYYKCNICSPTRIVYPRGVIND